MRAGRVLIARVIAIIPVILLVEVTIFAMLHLAPGDPVSVLIGDQAVDPAVVANLRHQLALDQPLPIQFIAWFGHTVQGDLGYSFVTHQPVVSAIAARLPVTAELTLAALILALAIALPLGVAAAVFKGSIIDYLNQGLAMIGGSMPAFWVGILLILLFAQRLRWLPASGFVPLQEDPRSNVQHLVLPAITLSLGFAVVISRVVRASMLEVLSEDYIRTARAKGLDERRVLIRHALRAALLPTITIIGLETGHLLGGAVVTETIFALPGMGRLLIDGVLSRDFPMVQGTTLVLAILLVCANLVADLTYAAADPRVGSG
ncbi:MAG: ABC transporter permease [Thermomicrobiales bacterium]